MYTTYAAAQQQHSPRMHLTYTSHQCLPLSPLAEIPRTQLLLWTLWQAFNKGVAGIAPLPPGVGTAEWGCSEMRYY